MGKETPTPPVNQADREAEAAIKQWAERAEKNPRDHLETFLKHMKGWLQENQTLYQERKTRYEAAKSQHDKDSKAPIPYPDPFVVNYEMARDLANRLTGKLTRQGDTTSEYDEAKLNNPSEEVKKMVNVLWTRTVFPNFPMISNVLIQGVRHIMFENGSQLSIYPSGAITVLHEGQKKRYLPPFPNVRIEFQQFRS